MNSRERLMDIANLAFSLPYLSDNDAAAIRELDQLLADLAKYVNVRVSNEAESLIERLAQAGYGEK